MAMIYRTTGVWGPGLGRNLTAAEGDANIYTLDTRIVALETDRPQPDNLASASAVGTELTFYLQSGTALGPIELPVLRWRWRGDWLPTTIYAALDTFRVVGEGIFLVLLDHTSAATFDPDATGPAQIAGTFVIGDEYTITTVGTTDFTAIGAASNTIGVVFTATGAGTGTGTATPTAPLYFLMIGAGTNTLLGELADVTLTGAVANDILSFNGTDWINRTPAAITALLSDFVGDTGSPGGGIKGLVPAPVDGDAAAGRALDASGDWLGIADRTTATLPLDVNALIEIADPSGSPPTYEPRSTRISDILTAGDITLGSTAVALGSTVTTIAGLTLTAPNIGAATGSSLIVTGLIQAGSASALGIGGDVFLYRHSASVLAQRNSTNPQAFRVYNTYNGTDDEYFEDTWAANTLFLGTQKTGAGVARDLAIRTGGVVAARIHATTQLIAIGPSAALTASFPALKRNATGLEVKLGDDSAFAPLASSKITTSDTAFMHNTSAALANGAGAGAGTLTNAPAAGNPTKWIPINDNGTTRHIPAW